MGELICLEYLRYVSNGYERLNTSDERKKLLIPDLFLRSYK